MKKIIGIALSMILLLSCVSCGAEKQIQYTFYKDGNTNGSVGTASDGFENSNGLHFGYTGNKVASEKTKTGTTQKYELNSQTVTLEYVSTNQMQYVGKEKKMLDKHGIVDNYVYNNENNTTTLSLYRETGNLKNYFIHDHSWNAETSKCTMTDKELIDKARSVVAHYYGADALEKYICEEVYYYEKNGESFVDFKRLLHGYATEGLIRVIIRNDGLVRAIVCNWHYEFDEVEDDVSQKMIKNAEAALRDKIPKI